MDILERLATAPYGAFAIDLDQNIVFWNPRAERILGYEPHQVLGRKCHEVLKGTALDGATPFCAQDCPAMAAARTGNIPAARQAQMQCSTSEIKRVAVIPLVAQDKLGQTLLVHMFHEIAEDHDPTGRYIPRSLAKKGPGYAGQERPRHRSEPLHQHPPSQAISNATEKVSAHAAMAAVLRPGAALI